LHPAIIFGAGGHARVLISLLLDLGQHEILGIYDLQSQSKDEVILGYQVRPMVPDLKSLFSGTEVDFFLAIGSNELRRIWWDKVKNMGFSTPNLISPYAHIDRFAVLGLGNIVCAGAFIGPGAKLGNNNLINTGAIIEHEVLVGSHCHFAPSSTIAGRSIIHDECFIGVGSTVIHSKTVAAKTILGAGAVLVDDIKISDGVYVGVPAKIVMEGV
jgi:UDP-perosamine 4-acetyltransferase